MTLNLAILLCTYNGTKFLKPQLESFDNQSYKNWQLFVFDDCSNDDTKTIVNEYATKYPTDKINFISNEKQLGFVKNFLNSIVNVPSNLNYYAFSDQDDIWMQNKLERAVDYLKKIDDHIPALYCSRTTLTDETVNKIGVSSLFKQPPSFSNSLVQSIAGGNTMVLNKAARDLIAQANLNINIVSHDWFIYQLISGAGGVVYYDSHSEILYRQHSNNLIGSNNSILAKLSRIKSLLNNSFKSWNDRNIEALIKNIELLTQENQVKLNYFIKARESSLIPRLRLFVESGIYRQTFVGNIALFIGCILNKI
jgi:glycosyltransferase involved in cell wall biosynthesis